MRLRKRVEQLERDLLQHVLELHSRQDEVMMGGFESNIDIWRRHLAHQHGGLYPPPPKPPQPSRPNPTQRTRWEH